jgi:hypothetical protein
MVIVYWLRDWIINTILKRIFLKKTWRYTLAQEFTKKHVVLENIHFQNRWIRIADGAITIQPQYAWDGCSPAYKVPVIKWWVGIPDGWSKNADGYVQSYWATCVHDSLCQFRGQVEISKEATVELFYDMLVEGGFPRWLAKLYCWFVYNLGPQEWRGYAPEAA